jgi:O-antigen ligase
MPPRFTVFALYALVAVSLWSPGSVERAASGTADLLRYAFFLSLSGAIILHTVLRSGIPLSRAPEWAMLAGFLLYTSVSALWSDGGLNAGIKAGLIFSALLVSICAASEVGLAGLLRIFYNSLSVFVVLSVLVVFLYPESGIQTGWMLEGDWRGIAAQKNGLGAVASLVFVGSLTLPVIVRADRRGWALAWCVRFSMVALSALCMVNSGSRGAMLISAVGLALVAVARLPRAVQRAGMLGLAVAVLPVVVVALSTLRIVGDDFEVFGYAIDSNSRITLWAYGLTQLDGRELLGFGVDGFWTPQRVQAFRDVHGWVLDNFHNGYVTILVEGGLVGISLALASLGFLFLLYAVAIGNLRDSYVALAFAYAGMFLIGNLTENEIGRSTSLGFIMFLSLSFALRPHLLRALAGRPAGDGVGTEATAGRRHVSAAPTFS